MRKFLDRHYMDDYSYFVLIPYEEETLYKQVIEEYDGKVNFIIRKHKTIGEARKLLANASIENGDYITIFADDNSTFDITAIEDVKKIFVSNPQIYWIGAYKSLYELYHKSSTMPDLYPVRNVTATQVYAVRTQALKENNFDENLCFYEDGDLLLRFVLSYGADSVKIYKKWRFKKKRHEPGGLTKTKREITAAQVVSYLNKKYKRNIAFCTKNGIGLRWSVIFKEMKMRKIGGIFA